MVNLGAFLVGNKPAVPQALPQIAVPKRAALSSDGAESPPGPSPAPESPSRTRLRDASPALGAPHYASRTSESGPYNARSLAAVLPRHEALDFSFLEIDDARSLLRVEPRVGRLVAAKGGKAVKAALGTRTAAGSPTGGKATRKEGATDDGTAWDFGPDSRSATEKTKDGYFVVRAGQETYAFKDDMEDIAKKRAAMLEDDDMKYEIDANGKLVMKKKPTALVATGGRRYHCSALNLSHNKLTVDAVAVLPPVLVVLTVDPMANLTTLDLSFNVLTAIPPVDGLPLHTLLLHSNRIPTLQEAAKLQVMHRTLRKLTLHDNPLQERTSKYKYAVLHQLPFLTFLDEVRVTNKDRERVAIFEELFVSAKQRGTTRKFLPPIASPAHQCH